MLVSAKNDDEAATAAKIAAILEEPPRMGNSDLGVAFSRNQPAWQQRSQQLLKRLNVRGGEADSSLIAPLLAGAFADRIARPPWARWTLSNWQTAWERCSMPTTR
ncbi:ATP-dependent helicase HrpB [Escherichia coli]|uniref:ATP-dependent helicase HrpB n=1 Tax=Escherichia coli TaxID=562 RepID=A0A376TL42_ECOLX|nr:ATP-dependent helicase HrpB [Escherichia coli]